MSLPLEKLRRNEICIFLLVRRFNPSVKILGVSTTYSPAYGGSETYSRTLYEGLAAFGHEVHLITQSSAPCAPSTEDRGGITLHLSGGFLKELGGPDRVLWEDAFFGPLGDLAHLKGMRFDVIHSQNQAGLLLASYLKHHFACPLIASFHETNPEEEPFGKARSEMLLQTLPYDAILAGSSYFAHQAIRFGAPREKVFVIPFGLPRHVSTSPDSRNVLRKRHGIPVSAFVIILLARFTPRKRQTYLLQATSLLIARGLPIHVCLVGSSNSGSESYRNQVLAIAMGKALSKHVSVFVNTSDETVAELIASADIGTLVSESEGFGIALLEYMAHNIPVVATNIPGVRDIIEHQKNGILVPKHSFVALADAITILYSDEALRIRIREAARTRLHSDFAVDGMLDKVQELYFSLIAGHGVHHSKSLSKKA